MLERKIKIPSRIAILKGWYNYSDVGFLQPPHADTATRILSILCIAPCTKRKLLPSGCILLTITSKKIATSGANMSLPKCLAMSYLTSNLSSRINKLTFATSFPFQVSCHQPFQTFQYHKLVKTSNCAVILGL